MRRAVLDARVAAVEDAEEALRGRVRSTKATFHREHSELHRHHEVTEELRMGVFRSVQPADEREAILSRRARELDERSIVLARHEEELSPLEDEAISRGVALVVYESLIRRVEADLTRRELAIGRLLDERVEAAMRDLHEKSSHEMSQLQDRLRGVEDGAARRISELEASLKVGRAAQDEATREAARLFTKRENHLSQLRKNF